MDFRGHVVVFNIWKLSKHAKGKLSIIEKNIIIINPNKITLNIKNFQIQYNNIILGISIYTKASKWKIIRYKYAIKYINIKNTKLFEVEIQRAQIWMITTLH